MEMAEHGGAKARTGRALGGAPVLAGRARLLAVHRAADAAEAEADKAKPVGKAGAVSEDNREFIQECIRESLQERIRERIREDIDYDLRVRLPHTLARANALQMAFDSC